MGVLINRGSEKALEFNKRGVKINRGGQNVRNAVRCL